MFLFMPGKSNLYNYLNESGKINTENPPLLTYMFFKLLCVLIYKLLCVFIKYGSLLTNWRSLPDFGVDLINTLFFFSSTL